MGRTTVSSSRPMRRSCSRTPASFAKEAAARCHAVRRGFEHARCHAFQVVGMGALDKRLHQLSGRGIEHEHDAAVLQAGDSGTARDDALDAHGERLAHGGHGCTFANSTARVAMTLRFTSLVPAAMVLATELR